MSKAEPTTPTAPTRDQAPGIRPRRTPALHLFRLLSAAGKLSCKAHKESADPESVGDTKVLAPEAAHLPEQGPATSPATLRPHAADAAARVRDPPACARLGAHHVTPTQRVRNPELDAPRVRAPLGAGRSPPGPAPGGAQSERQPRPPRRWRYWLQRSGGRGFPGGAAPPRPARARLHRAVAYLVLASGWGQGFPGCLQRACPSGSG